MLAIKLKRIGKKKQPTYRVIVGEKRHRVYGLCAEDLGWLNPKTRELNLNKERATYWLSCGAQPTDTVYNLFVKNGVIKAAKRSVHKKKKVKAETNKPESK